MTNSAWTSIQSSGNSSAREKGGHSEVNFSISSLVKENEDILQHSSYQMMWGRILGNDEYHISVRRLITLCELFKFGVIGLMPSARMIWVIVWFQLWVIPNIYSMVPYMFKNVISSVRLVGSIFSQITMWLCLHLTLLLCSRGESRTTSLRFCNPPTEITPKTTSSI